MSTHSTDEAVASESEHPTTRREQRDGERAEVTQRRAVLGAALAGVIGAGGAAAFLLGNRDPARASDATALAGAMKPDSVGGAGPLEVGDRTGMGGAIRRGPSRPDDDAATASSDGMTSASGTGGDRPAAQQPQAAGGPGTRDESFSQTQSAQELPPGKQYTGFAEAAAAAEPLESVFDPSLSQAHLLRRATFGPRPSDVEALEEMGIDRWLSAQLSPESVADPDGDAAWGAFSLAGADASRIFNNTQQYSWDAMVATTTAVLGRQIFSSRQLFEVVVDVLSNHLHVPVPSESWDSSPGYLVDVIRANAFGSYKDMLLAAMRHPAMLQFLNNDVSTKSSVNENLGRELLELHTVGVSGGYTEEDVRNSAYILTGRGIERDPASRFVYRADRHYTGPVRVLDFEHENSGADGGLEVGDAYLSYLAEHPSTARLLARKLATRFVTDVPSDDLIERLAQVYLDNDTSILEVVRAIFLSSDFWSAQGTKVRRPLEDAVGAARVLDARPGGGVADGLSAMYWQLTEAGQAPHNWSPPNGFPDVAAAWLNSGGMVMRWNAHRALVGQWWKGIEIEDAEVLAAPADGASVAEWLDAIGVRLTGQPLSAEAREAMLAFLEVGADAPAADSVGSARHLLALVLDSATFQIR